MLCLGKQPRGSSHPYCRERKMAMKTERMRFARRMWVATNYLSLLLMNLCFYMAIERRGGPHWADAICLASLAVVVITFIQVHCRSGLWALTHAKTDTLDERQVQITHTALRHSYGWFSVICLVIMLVHAVSHELVAGLDLVITVPLVASLIYLAHTLPGSVLAWTEGEVPGEIG